MFYSKEQTKSIDNQTFAFLDIKQENKVFTVTLNRPEKKNALHPVMMNELAFAFNHAHHNQNIWAVVLKANGDVFCAGADLKAFMGLVEKTDSTIPQPNSTILLSEVFRQLHKPCLAQVEGDVYAGGLMLICGCTHVIASQSITLSLPEVKRGLFPYQVMANLLELMPARKVIDWCLMGNELSAQEAYDLGLITHLTQPNDTDKKLGRILKKLLANSPTAIRMGLEAFSQLKGEKTQAEHQYLMNMLMRTIQTKDAKEGLAAFKQKRSPVWSGE